MKRTGLAFAAFGLVACSSTEVDELPDDPMRELKTSTGFPVPDQALADRSGQALGRLEKGYEIFVTKCTECHEPRIAIHSGNPHWYATMHGMAWNASLDEADEEVLLAYLKAAANE